VVKAALDIKLCFVARRETLEGNLKVVHEKIASVLTTMCLKHNGGCSSGVGTADEALNVLRHVLLDSVVGEAVLQACAS